MLSAVAVELHQNCAGDFYEHIGESMAMALRLVQRGASIWH
jgi:hypothetical protein